MPLSTFAQTPVTDSRQNITFSAPINHLSFIITNITVVIWQWWRRLRMVWTCYCFNLHQVCAIKEPTVIGDGTVLSPFRNSNAVGYIRIPRVETSWEPSRIAPNFPLTPYRNPKSYREIIDWESIGMAMHGWQVQLKALGHWAVGWLESLARAIYTGMLPYE